MHLSSVPCGFRSHCRASDSKSWQSGSGDEAIEPAIRHSSRSPVDRLESEIKSKPGARKSFFTKAVDPAVEPCRFLVRPNEVMANRPCNFRRDIHARPFKIAATTTL